MTPELVDSFSKLVQAIGVIVIAYLAYRSRHLSSKIDRVSTTTTEIHSLVNSGYTAALRAELEATIRELAMMDEVILIKHLTGGYPEPSEDTLALMEVMRVRIRILQNDLERRSTLDRRSTLKD